MLREMEKTEGKGLTPGAKKGLSLLVYLMAVAAAAFGTVAAG
jgi:hypothetical protein